jgi:HPt (histidine-containing phosphotransfer) domain-containing protein
MIKNNYFKGNALLDQLDGDREVFRSVVKEALIHIPSYLHGLNIALSASDTAEIHKKAHKLKGGLLSMRAEIPAKTANMIENAAENGNLDLALQLKSRIDQEVNEAIEEMKISIIE